MLPPTQQVGPRPGRNLRVKPKTAVVLLLVTGLAAAGCSSGSSSSSPAPNTASPSGPSSSTGPADSGKFKISTSTDTKPAMWTPIPVNEGDLKCSGSAPDPNRGVTATTIKVGGLATLSNAGTSVYGDSIKGAKARFDAENAKGGVNGRMFNYIGGVDDGANAQQNADAGRKLAESDKVFAVAPILTSFSNYADVLCKDVVPGTGFAFNTGMCERANLFGFTGCLLPTSAYNSIGVGNFVQVLKDSSDKSVVLLGVDNESAKSGIASTKVAFERAGLKVVLTDSTLLPGQPPADASPLVRKILSSNGGKPPAMVYHVTDFVNVTAVTQALVAAGYKGKQISAVGYDPRLAGLKTLDGTYTSLTTLPFESTGNATVKQMSADIDKYGDGAPKSLPTLFGYLSADMLIQGIKAAGKDLTVDSLLKAMNSSSFHYGDGIFSGRTVWPANHYYGAPCQVATLLTGGKYTVAVPLTCNDPFKP